MTLLKCFCGGKQCNVYLLRLTRYAHVLNKHVTSGYELRWLSSSCLLYQHESCLICHIGDELMASIRAAYLMNV